MTTSKRQGKLYLQITIEALRLEEPAVSKALRSLLRALAGKKR
jgi:hypothetical protein